MEKLNGKIWSLSNTFRAKVPYDSFPEFLLSIIYINWVDRHEITPGFVYGHNKSVYSAAQEMISHYDEETIQEAGNDLSSFSKTEIQELVKSLLFEQDNKKSYRSCESSPEVISDLAIKLLQLSSGDIIFDLGSGVGTFLARINEYSVKNGMNLENLNGIDVNIDLVYLSIMALSILQEKEKTPQIGWSSSISERITSPFSKGYVYPPFGIRFFSNVSEIGSRFPEVKFNSRNTSDWIFVDRFVKHADWGKLPQRVVAIMTPRALFNEVDKEYRNALLRNGYIEGIIELPAGILGSIGIKVCMVILSSGNKKVKLIDATEMLGPMPKKMNRMEMPVDKIAQLYFSVDVPSRKKEDLINSSNLLPSIVLLDSGVVKNGIPLGEVAEVFSGTQYTIRNFEDRFGDRPTGYRILTSGDIEDGLVDWKRLQIIDYNDEKFDKYAVKKDDVVVTSKSSKVKTVVIDINPQEKILVTGGMIIIRPDVTKINPTYLKMFMDSEKGKNSLKKIQKGETIISLKPTDLSTLNVPMISLERQIEMANLFNSKLSTLLAYKKEIAKLENSLHNLFLDFEEFGE